jgi:hypothetical protein
MKKLLLALTCLPLLACGTIGGDYDPCEGATCGDACTICDPADADCVETAVVKTCQPDGSCAAAAPRCKGAAALTKPEAADLYATSADQGRDYCDEFGWYGDGACDAFCPDPDPDCDAQSPYAPCGGATCGDACTLCDPADPDCYETAVVKFCQADGSCAASAPACEGDYEPCGGAACGDSCTLCDPADLDCVETAEVKFCHADGSCSGTTPACGD